MGLDFAYQSALERSQQLIDEAAGRRLCGSRRHMSWPVLRAWLAIRLRRIADRLEPATQHSQVRLLRAVAHHEVDIDQAIRLLDFSKAQHSRR